MKSGSRTSGRTLLRPVLDEGRGKQRRLEVVEVNAGQGLRDVQFARFAVQADAVPVEHAVGRVRVLLDFKDDQPRAERVNPSAGQEHGVARPHAHAMKALGHGAGLDLAARTRRG